MNELFTTSLNQGLIFSVLAIGVFITYKILDFPDLSVEGTFPLGAFIFAKFALMGLNPVLSTIIAGFCGALAGSLTYALHIKLKIEPILAGILTMTILYSVNLRVNSSTSNIPLYSTPSLFKMGPTILVLALIVILSKVVMDIFLSTEIGYLLIATGDNQTLVKTLGISPNKLKLIGLMISNAFVAISGALMAQMQSFADITMGTSIIVYALASIIIGYSFLKNSSLLKGTTRAIIGAIVYKMIGGVAIQLGLAPTDLRAISAIIVIVFIAYNNFGIGRKIKVAKGGKKFELHTN